MKPQLNRRGFVVSGSRSEAEATMGARLRLVAVEPEPDRSAAELLHLMEHIHLHRGFAELRRMAHTAVETIAKRNHAELERDGWIV